MISTARENYN